MSDSPASRPKRISSFASFYIDEDDFENENVMTSKSKKPSKEEVFGLAEKYESDSDSKSNAFESSSSDSDEFEIVASTKKKANSVKKSIVDKKPTTKKASVIKTKSSTPKTPLANKLKAKKLEDNDDIELVIDEVQISGSENEPELNNSQFKENHMNIDESNIVKSSKGKKSVSAKKSNPIQSIKKTTTTNVNLRPLSASSRLKIPTSVEKVIIPGQMCGPRRVGLSRSAPIRPLSPVKLKKPVATFKLM